jgi:hypothetical protein
MERISQVSDVTCGAGVRCERSAEILGTPDKITILYFNAWLCIRPLSGVVSGGTKRGVARELELIGRLFARQRDPTAWRARSLKGRRDRWHGTPSRDQGECAARSSDLI